MKNDSSMLFLFILMIAVLEVAFYFLIYNLIQ